jgi:hypothetical protein
MPTKTIDKAKPRARKPVAAKPPAPCLGDVARLVGAATSWAMARREVLGIGFTVGPMTPDGVPGLEITVAFQGVGYRCAFEIIIATAAEKAPRPAAWLRDLLTRALRAGKAEAAQQAASGPEGGGP